MRIYFYSQAYFREENGSILILVLWLLTLLSVLVAVITSEIRISTKAVINLQDSQVSLVRIYSSMAIAKMELMLELMPEPVAADQDAVSEVFSRFNGRIVKTHYPTPGMVVRIFSHAGKINLRKINRNKRGQILAALTAGRSDELQIESALDAWEDWTDSDDLKRLNGAEKNYYMSLEPPYRPRNEQIDTVGEVYLIKGLGVFFRGRNLHNIFTVYGVSSRVNPNLATAETLILLPGLDPVSVDAIIACREAKRIASLDDLAVILQPEQLGRLGDWLQYGASEFYTIVVYPKPDNKNSNRDQVIFGYAEIVKTAGSQNIPKTVCVMPLYPITPSVLKKLDGVVGSRSERPLEQPLHRR